MALIISSVAAAGVLEFGLGARAIGMGQAQVAASNDSSALTYNPAALSQARDYWGLQTRNYFFQYSNVGTHSKLYLNDIEQEDPYTTAMAVGAILPLSKRLTFGLNVYYPSDTTLTIELFRGPTIARYRATRWFWASGGVAYAITKKISVGAGGHASLGFKGSTLNLDLTGLIGALGLDMGTGPKDLNSAFQIDVVLTGSYYYGALIRPYKWLSLGAFYRWKLGNRVLIPIIIPPSLTDEMKLFIEGFLYVTNPPQYVFGLALYPTKNITLAFDMQRDLWSQIHPELRFQDPAGVLAAKNPPYPHLDDVWWPKFGIEWKDDLGGKYSRMNYAVRTGYSYYTSPYNDKVEKGTYIVDNNAHFYSGGFSVGYKPRRRFDYISVDYFYEYVDLVERENRSIQQNPSLIISDGYVIYQGFGVTILL